MVSTLLLFRLRHDRVSVAALSVLRIVSCTVHAGGISLTGMRKVDQWTVLPHSRTL